MLYNKGFIAGMLCLYWKSLNNSSNTDPHCSNKAIWLNKMVRSKAFTGQFDWMIDEQTDWHLSTDTSVFDIHQLLYSTQKRNYLHLCSIWHWHFKYSGKVWQSWRVTTTRAVFNILCHLIEPLTQIVIYLFQIRHMRRITIIELVNIHHFHPKDYTSYLKWYSIKYDRRNTEWRVLAWIWLMLWKKKKKKHFLGIKIQVKITWGNSSYIPLPMPHPTLYSSLCLGTKPKCTAPHKPRGCNRMLLWNI